jgi:hypothetical protein
LHTAELHVLTYKEEMIEADKENWTSTIYEEHE